MRFRGIFLGFAFDKQSKLGEAENAYNAAAKSKPGDPQAWQGLIKLYEKQNATKLDLYQNAALKLATIYANSKTDEKYKCQDVIDKFIAFVKNEGSRRQIRTSLEILLPTSSVYEYLEGRIPHPSLTYERIVELTEADEKERINKEIGERRTRLGAKINQVTLDVKREVLRDSPLEELYESIIDWSNDDDKRRHYEERLLQRCYEALIVLPLDQKQEKRLKVEKLAMDMVIIKHPFKLAWDIALEWQDHPLLEQWDAGTLREYIFFFPDSPLSKVLEGYMTSEISPFPPPPAPAAPAAPADTPQVKADADESEDDDDGGVGLNEPLTAEDRLLLMTDGISDASTSILAHRAMGEYYAFLEEYESVAELMRAGIKLLLAESAKTALPFQNASQSLTAHLGTALVFYQTPKNHPEAKALFDGLLSKDPSSTPALIGIGLIYEEEEDFPAAIDFLQRALLRDPNNIRVRAEAGWAKALDGDHAIGMAELEACLEAMEGSDLRSRELRAQTQYRIGICIWNIDASTKARKDRTGAYAYFLAALKSNLHYAPAYTSLGIFYSDYSKDKKRARKCFQKAFELSASEVEAAERLARAFAEQGEWDLVEAVSQRVVDSGKLRPPPGSKKKGVSWPFAALGIAELNKQDYSKSIVSFQSALRISPNDYHSWVGLAESYHNSGRYVAATKAFTHAEKFEQDVQQQGSGDTWFSKYMLANVKRELGEYETAISEYRSVLESRPTEFGVSLALVQTLVESAWDSIDKGLFGQAAQLSKEGIEAGKELVGSRSSMFNLWKALGDACSVYSWVQGRISEFPHQTLKTALKTGATEDAFDILSEVDAVGTGVVFADGLYPDDEQEGLDLTRCLQAAILCHKCALHAASTDVHAQAVAYFNLGWTEYRAHVCLSPILNKKSTKYIKAAVHCFKRAIELEAGNAEFWNALGVVTSELAPKIAQHSFVRSLYLNERSAQTWANLGTLYLLQNDVQLANESFTRAQSTDPDFAHAWLGQGLVALLFGHPKEAKLLFTHAMEISESSSVIIKRQYALSVFGHLLTTAASSSIVDLVQPVFALNQLDCLISSELSYQHLSSLFLERIEDTTGAVGLLTNICGKIEAQYEITESPKALSNFALARADLARSQLAAGSYEAAIESADTALELSAEDAGNELSADARRKCRLSAHLTLGLANYHNNDPKEAVAYLDAALSEAQGNPDCICLLAQILWAAGDDSSRAKSRDHLFDCVENHPGHVQSVLLLGTIALLDSDFDTIEAVTADLQTLRTSTTISDDEQAHVGELLRAIAALSKADTDQAILTEVQAEVFLFPSQPHGWSRLARVASDSHGHGADEYAATMALHTARRAVPPRGKLEAADLAMAFAGTGKVGDAQRGIFAAPWEKSGWESLGSAVGGKA
jgi:superkiller protein 3